MTSNSHHSNTLGRMPNQTQLQMRLYESITIKGKGQMRTRNSLLLETNPRVMHKNEQTVKQEGQSELAEAASKQLGINSNLVWK